MKPLLDINKAAGAVGLCTEAGENAGIRLGAEISAEGNRVTNLADPEENQDAVTLAYLERRLRELAAALGGTA